jgi:hypothetical protein
MSTEMDALTAADPCPEPALARLDLAEARRELRREITGSAGGATTSAGRPGRRWVPAVAAAAAVAVVAAGGVWLGSAGDGSERPDAPPAASPTGPSPSGGQTDGPSTVPAPVSGSGLAPTSANLHQVVLDAPGWGVRHLDDDPTYGGSLAWEHGVEELELTWYPAADYASYLQDRRQVGPARGVDVLGQQGKGFSYGTFDQEPADGVVVVDPTADPDANDPAVPDVTRWQVLLPPVGHWFLEADITLRDRADIVPMLGRLRRVDRDAWLADLARQDLVVPVAGAAFLAEARREVPMPPGVTVTVEDLRLPQDAYQARSSFLRPVMCGWAAELLDARAAGDATAEQRAVTALQGSADWPVMRAMAAGGDFPSVFAADVQRLVAGGSGSKDRLDLEQAWGC